MEAIAYAAQMEAEFSSEFKKAYEKTYRMSDTHIHLTGNSDKIRERLAGNGFEKAGGVWQHDVEYWYNSQLFCYLRQHPDSTTSVHFSSRPFRPAHDND